MHCWWLGTICRNMCCQYPHLLLLLLLCVQIKGTVLLMPNGSDLVTSAPLQTIQCDKKVRFCWGISGCGNSCC